MVRVTSRPKVRYKVGMMGAGVKISGSGPQLELRCCQGLRGVIDINIVVQGRRLQVSVMISAAVRKTKLG